MTELNRRELLLLSAAGALQPVATAAAPGCGQQTVSSGSGRASPSRPITCASPSTIPDFWVSTYARGRAIPR